MKSSHEFKDKNDKIPSKITNLDHVSSPHVK